MGLLGTLSRGIAGTSGNTLDRLCRANGFSIFGRQIRAARRNRLALFGFNALMVGMSAVSIAAHLLGNIAGRDIAFIAAVCLVASVSVARIGFRLHRRWQAGRIPSQS